MKKSFLIVVLVSFLFSNFLFSQNDSVFSQNDSTFAPDFRRNIIKWNTTPFLLWSTRNINLSYERILKPYRSFSVNAGFFELPSIGLGLDSLNFTRTQKKKGFSVSGDYRFYFRTRNKKSTPDGLFWGPYTSFHYTQYENHLVVLNSDIAQGELETDLRLGIIGVGVELGYQFVIKEKFTVDLIFMGPSYSLYTGKIKFEGDLTVDEESEYLKAIHDMLVAKFPYLDDFVKEGTFNNSGFSRNLGYGMRYMIQLGFRF